MKKYSYEARDQATDKIVKANVQANSESAAAKLLINQGFTPLDIKEIKENDNLLSKLSNRITTKDRVVFTRQLATLIGAGLPLSQSLNTVLEQTQNKKLQSIVQDISVSVEGGKSLSESFSKFPEVFDQVFLSLVGAGEASGTLDNALQRIAYQQEKDALTIRVIKEDDITYKLLDSMVNNLEELAKDYKENIKIIIKEG